MNFSVVPDFVAISGLIGVFGSLLRRTRQTRLNYWLVGWIMLLIHIAAQFVCQNSEGDASGANAISVSMLVLAANAFIWASNGRHGDRWRNFTRALVSALPDAAFIACATYGVDSPWPYALLTCAGLGLSIWAFGSASSGAGQNHGGWRTAMTVVVYAVQGALLASHQLSSAVSWILCWHYLAVAAFYRLGAPDASTGVMFTMVSFIAWAFVFPVGDLMDVLWPAVHVEEEVWNLPKFLVATGMIFTLLEEQLSNAEHASLHDALTGLPNRRMFADRLRRALLDARAEGESLALLMIDLDGFKQINDRLGHAVGDELLRWAAMRFSEELHGEDVLARVGGDEFAVILSRVDHREAAQGIAHRLQRSLAAGMSIHGHALSIQASIGISMYPEDAGDATLLYAAADLAMYERKPYRQEGSGGEGTESEAALAATRMDD
ncbi:GGDEF domain-containing protein [Dyella jejuensis]|uniref:GGDEF domain-containing protein n=1 Tax=Dyella jejuensis TaxID=1432009 RepID=A0ABW8JGJ5_9GAMM